MKKLLAGYSCFPALILLISLNIYSQQLPVTTYSSREGAPVFGANCVFQDKQGWMWFTNGHDVVQYNGSSFKSFYPREGFKLEFAFGILEVNNEIWILSAPYTLKVTGDSLIPLQVSDKPLDLINNTYHQSENYFLMRNGLGRLHNDRMEMLINDSSLIIMSESNLVSYNDSLLISYERQKSLVIFNTKTNTYSKVMLPVLDIRKDKSGTIYLLIKGEGLVLLKDLLKKGNGWEARTELFFSLTAQEFQISIFVIDHYGNFWIPDFFRQLIKITPSRSRINYTEANGLPNLWFTHLFIDRENNLWITFNNNICKVNQSLWQRYTKNEGLAFNHVTFILPGRDNVIYFGSENGLNVFSDGKIYQVYSGQKPLLCSYIFQEGEKLFYLRDSTFWVSQVDTNNFRLAGEKKLANLEGTGVQILTDKKGTIFITTNRGLFAWYQNRSIKILPGNKYYRSAFVDSRNQIWLGEFNSGLSRYKIEYLNGELKLELMQYIDSSIGKSSVRAIRALKEDLHKNIIAGTRFDGLFYITIQENDIAGIKHFGREEGLNSNNIWALEVDSSNTIWVGNTLGLNILKQKNGDWEVSNASKQRQIYFVNLLAYDKNKNLWLSNHPGVVRFNPTEILPSYPFSVSITDKFNEGKPVNGSGFSYKENNFSFSFSSNSFIDEKFILYSYRLTKNGTGAWSNPAVVHTINYSSLRPGKYTFQVKALNVNGKPSVNEASYVFEIFPPFWERAWFIILLALATAAGLYALYKYRIAQIMRLQVIRNNISRNLHDDIGSSLSNINILNELAKRNISNPSGARSYLAQAGEDIQRISEALSDIVWNINPRYDQIGNLFIRMKRYAADMLDGKLIKSELIFPTEEINLTLPMDKRRDFYLIYKEAINNLVKYSGATEAIVNVSIDKNRILLLIEDNGVGFYEGKISTGNGLHNMKQRAEKWNAPLLISSEPGKGTKIVLEMKT